MHTTAKEDAAMNILAQWTEIGLLAKLVVAGLVFLSGYVLYSAGRLVAYSRQTKQRLIEDACRNIERLGRGDEASKFQPPDNLTRRELELLLAGFVSQLDNGVSGSPGPTRQGVEAARSGVLRAVSAAQAESKVLLRSLTAVGGTAPLVGIFGSVIGIINSLWFASQGAIDIKVFSVGMAEALITTCLGLLIGIPALWLRCHFKSRIERSREEAASSLLEALDMLLLRRGPIGVVS
jgi:biopolymer transport protein ExbB